MLGVGCLVRRSVVVGCVLGLLTGGAHAQQETVRGRLKIMRASIKETSRGQTLLRVTIANAGGKADRLLRASTPVAERVWIFDPLGNEGNGLLIPGSSELVISAGGGPRIELSGLKRPLRSSDTVNVLLVFRQAGKVVIDVLVEAE